jgi:hypothetical protein
MKREESKVLARDQDSPSIKGWVRPPTILIEFTAKAVQIAQDRAKSMPRRSFEV